MRRALLSLAMLLGAAPAAAHPYSEVFAALDEVLDDGARELPDAADIEPEVLAAWERELDAVLAAFHEAAAAEDVDFGTDFSGGTRIPTDYLNDIYMLVEAARLVAPLRNPAELVADAEATFALAEHLSREPSLVSGLVGVGNRARSFGTYGQELMRLDPPRQAAVRAAADLHRPRPMGETVRAEGARLAAWLEAGGDEDALQDLLRNTLGDRRDVLEHWRDDAKRKAAAEQVADLYRQVADAGELPPAERAAAMRDVERREREASHLVQIVVPVSLRIFQTQDRISIDHELFTLAITGLLAGDVPGTVAGRAEYHPLPGGGFRLSRRVDPEYVAELTVDGRD